LVSHPKGRN